MNEDIRILTYFHLPAFTTFRVLHNTSHDITLPLNPLPLTPVTHCHKFQTPIPLKHEILYGQPLAQLVLLQVYAQLVMLLNSTTV